MKVKKLQVQLKKKVIKIKKSNGICKKPRGRKPKAKDLGMVSTDKDSTSQKPKKERKRPVKEIVNDRIDVTTVSEEVAEK